MPHNWFSVDGKTYVVLGLARSGLAAVKWLLAHQATVIVIDDDTQKIADVQKLGAQGGPIDWDQVAAVVQSPGVPLTHSITRQAHQKDIPVIGDMDIFCHAHPEAKFVGITGTNGKSTTTALIGHILKSSRVDCQVGGNIGVPVLDLPEAGTYVLELSSYQLDLSQNLNLPVVGWLNISPDHLDRHGSLEAYVQAKKHLFSSQTQCVVIGVDDEASEAVWKEISQKQKAIPVSVNRVLENGIYIQDGWLFDQGSSVLDVRSLPTLKGAHNYQNVAIAYGICRALHVSRDDIVKALQTFPGLAHRQEEVRKIKNITFINDSKGTNAEATATALATFDKIYWIAGGEPKTDGIDALEPYFPKIEHAFLIGEAQDRFAATLGDKVSYTKSGTLKSAVDQAYQMASQSKLANPVVLLSPACASFDQFQDFEHRGKTFCQLVQKLEE